MNVIIYSTKIKCSSLSSEIHRKRIYGGLSRAEDVNAEEILSHEALKSRVASVNDEADTPTVIHVFDSVSLDSCLSATKGSRFPMILSPSKNDVRSMIAMPEIRRNIAEKLLPLWGIIVSNHSVERLLSKTFETYAITKVISPAVDMWKIPYEQRELQFDPGDVVFFLPAALRPESGILKTIDTFKEMKESYLQLKLLLAGPAADDEYTESVLNEVENNFWLEYLGEVDHGQMASLMEMADVVLNTSFDEEVFSGGSPHVISEALSLGTPVLAFDNAENREIIEHMQTGLLFNGSQQFHEYLTELLIDILLRQKLGKNAMHACQERFDVAAESLKLQEFYQIISTRH